MLLTEYDQAEHMRLLKEESRAEGIEQGTTNTLVNSIKSLMGNTKWTVERCMEALNIPKAQWAQYIQLVQNG